MVVTLLGLVFTFLQNAASNRAALAVRRSEAAAVEAEGEAVWRGGAHRGAGAHLDAVPGGRGQIRVSLMGSAGGDRGRPPRSLAEAFTAAGAWPCVPFADLDLEDQSAEGMVNGTCS